MSVKKSTTKTTPDSSAPAKSRYIDFDDDGGWPEPVTPAPSPTSTSQNPEVSGFSKFIIPDEHIDFDDAAKRKHAVAVYRSFCLSLIAHEDRSRGYVRWCLGTVLNRLKDIRGGKKSISHGDLQKFLKGIGVKDDMGEEVRWAALAVPESETPTIGWTAMREKALALRSSNQPAKPQLEDDAEPQDDPFAAIPEHQKETVPGFDDLPFDEKRAIAKNAFGVVISKQSETPVKPKPEPKPDVGVMTPEKYHKLLSRVNKQLAEKMDAGFEWGTGDMEKTKKEIEEGINKATAIEAKAKTCREMLAARLKELKSKGAA